MDEFIEGLLRHNFKLSTYPAYLQFLTKVNLQLRPTNEFWEKIQKSMKEKTLLFSIICLLFQVSSKECEVSTCPSGNAIS